MNKLEKRRDRLCKSFVNESCSGDPVCTEVTEMAWLAGWEACREELLYRNKMAALLSKIKSTSDRIIKLAGGL